VITAVIAFYLNFFGLVVQLFEEVPALRAPARTKSEPPFVIAQEAALALFVVFGVVAAIRFHTEPALAA
jgi:hypothetical protein